MATPRDLVVLARPHFLVGGVAFHLLGLAIAARAGADVPLALAAALQAFVTATQLGVHFGNEAHDLAADRANPTRTRLAGGSRVLLDGRVPVALAHRASAAAFGLALVAGAAVLALAAGDLVPRLVLAAALASTAGLAAAYSAPPLRLHSRGVGELAAGAVVAGLVPLLPTLAAGLAPAGATVAVLAPLVLQVAALVTVLSLPDLEGDAAVGKRTLAVRVGPRRARRFVQAAWVACGLGTTATMLLGAPPWTALAGGAAFTAAVALPVLVLRRSWDTLALVGAGLVALQWLLTLAWALRLG